MFFQRLCVLPQTHHDNENGKNVSFELEFNISH